ncbi:ABC transporter ATP-binding protein [Parasphingopyxis marina]|uniref:ATP-binding cassette domain-containing protein n=1 Tax=Parasphingopyxis marina TaxID=2761622 RepID=A0A842HYB9_9SPHN|nr:ATP-binding cassette domain-containing protein [Parasphingopyxis marina]MBC2777341.1 ATP-binding cassette domain-containing protein [Parasphingopyxis marina]
MADIPKIELRGVSKSFGAKAVLRDVSFAVAPGEAFTIIGGSGSGKSVTLKCILGLMEADAGKIFVDGEEITAMKPAERDRVRAKFGMLFQGGALFDSLSVWRNVTFALTQGRLKGGGELRKIAEENLERVGLGAEVLDLRPSELSGGMQKRVALARAIAHRPEIVFFDEPTTGLDPIRADIINKLIVELVRDLGITAVAITHDMQSVEKISDRVAMLYDGAIVWTGPTADLRHSGNSHVDQFVEGRSDGPAE